MDRPPVVLALGFDLFFKPKLTLAAEQVHVQVAYAPPAKAVEAAEGCARVVADVSAPGVEEAVTALRKARPDLPVLVCYPHVEQDRADRATALGAHAVTRGHFARHLPDALAGAW